MSGWWSRESGVEHFNDWVTHGLPHLLTLHGVSSGVVYWVHVTAEAVERAGTGQGVRILVPVSHTLDEAHLDALFMGAHDEVDALAAERRASS